MPYLPSLDEIPELITTNNKGFKTTSASVFLGDIISLEDNAGFASYLSLLENGIFNLMNYRAYTKADGTDSFITNVRLSEEQFGTFQPGFDETQTISGDETIDAVFTQQEDAFNYAHVFRGTQGKLVFDLYVDSLKRDLPPFNWTDAQLLAIPDDELLRLVNSRSDVLKPADFDSPDDPANDADTLIYKVARDFPVGRKLIIKWRSDDGELVTVKGDTIGGNFIPYFQTFFASRFLDREYPDRHLTVEEEAEIDAPYANLLLDPTAASFDLTLVDATAIVGAEMIFKKLKGSPNSVTLAPQAGQTIEGASSYTLVGTSGSSVVLFSDGTTDFKIASTYNNSIGGFTGFTGGTTETVISDTVTAVKLAGTYTDGTLTKFTVNNGVLTYTGEDAQIPLIYFAALKLTPELETDTIRISIYKNGIELVDTRTDQTFNSVFQIPTSPPFQGFIGEALTSGDEIDVRGVNTSNTTSFIATDVKLGVGDNG